LIANALQPAKIESVKLDPSERRATVLVSHEQVQNALGNNDHNRQLASEISGWQIEVKGM
jgi:N utilization substance protein A